MYTHAHDRLTVSQTSSLFTTLDALRNLDRKHRTRCAREPMIPPKTYRSLGSEHGEPISAMQTNNCRDINTPRRDHSTVLVCTGATVAFLLKLRKLAGSIAMINAKPHSRLQCQYVSLQGPDKRAGSDGGVPVVGKPAGSEPFRTWASTQSPSPKEAREGGNLPWAKPDLIRSGKVER